MPKGKKATLLWIFAEGVGGWGVIPESKAFEELLEKPFFSLSLDIFEERGGGVKSKPYEEPFKLNIGLFPRKGGGGGA